MLQRKNLPGEKERMQQDRNEYYNKVKLKAAEIREKYNLSGPRILPKQIISILKKEGVNKVELWKDFKRVRGAYIINRDGSTTVAINSNLPRDPKAFTLAHELKHHLMDRNLGRIICSLSNVAEEIEIGAEIFATELIYPQQLFLDHMLLMGINKDNFEPRHIVELKKGNDTTLSYQSLAKRTTFLKIAPKGSLDNIKWKKLEEQIYGIPQYKKFRSRGKHIA
ncbi:MULTISPECIES: ImmA/IrrE family metallo-endopeptidase [Leptospira]|uniref:ImmA/IrrE family metallo-endopeptidase n=1 Tax=Leptospira TaxID=171 RepID=UPI001EF11AE6|nr:MULTISPECIES: ImmA/IrrE family metallo-endopeptidase [Leptospira]ULG76292.1 ImmA/IrrE family metallo-endopeptidase [Leptospira interrogans]